jgi:hypothetical protein
MSNSYDAFCKLINTDDDLKYLGDIASCGKLQNKRYIADFSHLQISDRYYDPTEYLSIPGSTSWVRFVSMNTKFFTTFRYIWDNDSAILIDREHGFNILGDVRYTNNHEEVFGKCINISMDCVTTGTSLNLLNLMRTSKGGTGENEWFSVQNAIRVFHKILTISNKNYIVGVIDTHGILWLNKNLLDKILEQNQENGHLYALKGWIQKENEKYETGRKQQVLPAAEIRRICAGYRRQQRGQNSDPELRRLCSMPVQRVQPDRRNEVFCMVAQRRILL